MMVKSWLAFKFQLLDFRPQLEKRSTSPSRKTREKLKAVDSDLETEIEEVRMQYQETSIYHMSLVMRQSFFSFQNNPEGLDPSCKMDLDTGN